MSRWRLALLALALLVLAAAGIVWLRIRPLAEMGAGYGAKQVCSCVFVGARSFGSCMGDLPPSMKNVRVEREGADSIRAFVPGFPSRSARYQPETGCTLF